MRLMRNSLKGCVYLILAMVLWSSAFIAVKIALVDIPPFLLIFSRLVLGSIFFLMFWKFKCGSSIARKDYFLLLLMGLLEPCLYFMCETTALQYTTASQAGIIFAFLPIFIIIFSYVFFRERPTLFQCVGGGLAILGVIVLNLYGGRSEHGVNPVKGNLLELFAIACAAGYTILLKKLSGDYSPFFLAGVQSFIGTIFFLPFAWLDSGFSSEVSSQSIIAVVYLGVIVTAGAYLFFNIGMASVTATQGGMYFNLIPIFTLLFSVVILDESINSEQAISMALVIFGVSIGLMNRQQLFGFFRLRKLFGGGR
jgi:drug/metabolite transporter (DMT)-like permease